jgi:predicted AlkP superfamily phosphohydrolase/phosphomutase
MKDKLIIIGLDGGTFDIIKPLAKGGKLPFLNQIMQDGVHGILRSTCPPVTAPAWTTFMTGKNPGGHGLFDFSHINNLGERELTYSTDCKSATIWDYLSEAGARLLLINIPMTYPPKPLNGVCIAGFPVPRDSSYVYPEGKLALVKAAGYLTDWTELLQKNKWRSKAAIFREIERIRVEVFSKLMLNESWDVAMIVISGTDHISHLELQKGNRKAVEKYYIFIDKLFYEFYKKGVFADTSFLIMSDHGFTKSEYVFYMNVWLAREGYLTYKMETDKTHDTFGAEMQKLIYGNKGKWLRVLGTIGLTRENVIFLAKKTGLIRLESYLPHSLISIFPAKNIIPDWKYTKAYMISNASKGVNINLQGREPNGIVLKHSYNTVRLDLVNKLRSVTLPDGRDVFEYVDIKENFYRGPFCEHAPDIVLWPSKQCNVKMGKGRGNFLQKITEAHHTSDGIFILKGDSVRKGFHCDLHIEDIAPTLLHYLGLSIPDDMDGSIIKEIFDSGSKPERRPVIFRDPIEKIYDEELLKVNETSISNQLKALGYL